MRFLLFLLAMLALPGFALELRVARDAEASEKMAARELGRYLQLLSGAPLRVEFQENGHTRACEGDICVGRTPESLLAFGLSDWKELRPDEVLYYVDDQGVLWIAGEGHRGALYAVYEFLEREYGARFFAPDCEYLSKTDGMLTLPPKGTCHRYASPFLSRVAFYQGLIECPPEFLPKTRSNFLGNFREVPEEWGGADSIIGFVHTMYQLVPESNFAQHPEWFALQNGERLAGPRGQLCLTNPQMRQELIRNVLKELRKDGGKSHFISVSQNDNHRFCQCKECTAFVNAHGNQTDLLLDCVNQVADAVAKEFPAVYVETLAYLYTRQPSKTILPRSNVAIRYCTIEAKSLQPLESPMNAALSRELLEWTKVTQNILVWNYVTDFAKYYLPHPNLHRIAEDTQFFQRCHVIHLFQQGAYNGPGATADLADLRIYLIARLLWNPQEDPKALVDEFLKHYYGPAEPYVKDYVETITRLALAHPDATDDCYTKRTKGWLSDQELAALWKRLFAGVKALKDTPVYGLRMKTAALPITMNLLDRVKLLRKTTKLRLPELRNTDPMHLIDWCVEVLKQNHATTVREIGENTVDDWRAQRQADYDLTRLLRQHLTPRQK
jgi:hypothetical protein